MCDMVHIQGSSSMYVMQLDTAHIGLASPACQFFFLKKKRSYLSNVHMLLCWTNHWRKCGKKNNNNDNSGSKVTDVTRI